MELFINDPGQVCLQLDNSSEQILLDDILPYELQGRNVTRQNFEQFFVNFTSWLDFENLPTRKFEASEKSEPLRISASPVDVSIFKLVREDNVINHERVRLLIQAIGKRWKNTAQPELLRGLILNGNPLETLSDRLDQVNTLSDKGGEGRTANRIVDFLRALMPAKYRQFNVALPATQTDEMISIILRWLGMPKDRKMTEGDNLQLRLNCRHVGIFDEHGNLNKARANAIADFIWSDESQSHEPEFSKMIQFVRGLDSNKISAGKAKQQAVKFKLIANRKKAKLARRARRKGS